MEIMEPEEENLRFYIFYRHETRRQSRENTPGIGICVYGTSSCSYDTVCRWIRRFQSGKKDIRDEPQSGAPKTVMNENAIALVRHAKADDSHISIKEITEICYFHI